MSNVAPDLYAALGVPRGADKATIRRAYRRRAKSAHPDAGGKEGEFALVKAAHDTLIDPVAREQYDLTGQFGTKEPDNRHAEAMNLLATALDRAMAVLYDRGEAPRESDMIGEMRRWLNSERAKPADAKREYEKNRGRTAELVNRFTVKGDEPNLMELILRERLRILDGEIAKNAAVLARLDLALELLGKFSFKADYVSDKERRKRAAERAYASGGMANVFWQMGSGQR